ncbi:MAG: HIT family protein [Lentimicrobium sp.]|nr:HIT family protein [Lentimicrobium sp.]
MNNSCPFCNIDNQSLAFASVSEFIAIYNISPILPGHSLVIPKKHITSLFELSEDEISDFFSFARRVTSFLCEVYESDAYDWTLQEGTEAGQSVEHLHLHIIPRKPGDMKEGEDWYAQLQQSIDPQNKERNKLSENEYREISLRLSGLWK